MIYIWRNNWFGQISEETAQYSTKLMQHKYSYLKILTLKITFFFLVTLFCALLAIRVFSLLFFLNAKSPIFAAGFFEEPPELTKDCKDPKWPPFPNNQIVKLAKIRQRSKIFMSGMKIFIRNYLIISIVLMLLANSKFAITPSRSDALKKNFL